MGPHTRPRCGTPPPGKLARSSSLHYQAVVAQPAQPKAYSSLGKFFVVPMLFGLGVALCTAAGIDLVDGDRGGLYPLIFGGFALWWSWRVLRARS